MGRVLHFDCFSGASGDMILGALLDAGLPLQRLSEALAGVLPPDCRVTAEPVRRAGIAATRFRVEGAAEAHPHRTVAEIVALIDRAPLSPSARDRAVRLFTRLAEAEAAVHAVPVDQVHLHEVGALDSVVDVVGAVVGLEWFGVDRFVASPLNLGHGEVECAHGRLPVPAPATARLVEGVPVYAEGPAMELTTPTGALLVTGHASSYGPLPALIIERIGYGAGERDVRGRPNVLRVVVGAEVDPAVTHHEDVAVIECEIDDMNPQLYGPLMERLLAGGALDAFYAPVQMKKGRPGILVTVLAPLAGRDALTRVLFEETTTIGVRYHVARRECLERDVVPVETPWGPVRVKVARRDGRVVNAAPEFDDCARLASERRLPVKDVQAAAWLAYGRLARSSGG